MPLSVLNNRERLIKTHRLIIECGRGERRQVVTFEISAGISDQSKTGRVRFRKAIEGKRSYGLNNFILRLSRNSLLRHAAPQFYFNVAHALFRSFEAHCPA